MASETSHHPATTIEANPSEPAAISTPSQPPTSATVPGTITADSPLPTPILTTPRLIVRPFHPQDAENISKHANSPTVAKHMSLAFPSPYTLSNAQIWINLNLTPPFNHYTICLLSSPTTSIGGIGIVPGRDVSAHTAEVGYWIGNEFAGQGLMTEALAGFTAWVFGERGDNGGAKEVKKLWAQVFAPHKASMRILEKCGYTAEGILKGHAEKFGEVMDVHNFGLTKGDWVERKTREQGQVEIRNE